MNRLYKKIRSLSSKRNVFLFYIPSFLFFFFALSTNAAGITAEFKPLVGIPGITNLGSGTTLPQFVNAIYLLTISIGSLIAVVRIAWAGVKYSISEVITDKETAKHEIRGVLLGLAILLLPFVVLNTINPQLVDLNVLKSAPPPISGGATDANSAYRAGDSIPLSDSPHID